MEMPSKHI